jgi:nitrite reductase (NO-forming)
MSTETERTGRRRPWRVTLLALAGTALLTGLDAALLRLGLPAPVPGVVLADAHGPIMVYGFLGGVICLERAVALRAVLPRSEWGYAAPAACALGAALLLAGAAGAPIPARALAGGAWCAALLVLTAMYLAMLRAQRSPALLVQLLAALSCLGGAALWARGLTVPQVFPWWAAFLVLTICGERLDLARLSVGAGPERRVLAESAVLFVALPIALLVPALGYPLLGLALAALICDLAVHDVARRTLRRPGAPRLMAVCMLGGYAWALAAATSWVIGGPAADGYRYDFTVHAITLGFVVSMVLAHAPIIVPAIVHRPLPFHPVLWAVWGVLQGGLLVRVLAGARDAAGAWRFGGAIGVTALAALPVCLVTLIVAGTRRHAHDRARRSPGPRTGAGTGGSR